MNHLKPIVLRPGPRAALVAAVLTAMLTGCAARAPIDAPSGPLVLAAISWNMHQGRGDLPRLVADLSSGRLTGTPVTDYVILLQEVVEGGPHDVAAIARAQNLSTVFVPVREHRRGMTGNAILATGRLANARSIDLPRERQPRGAAAATVNIAGRRLFVVSTHLENRLSLRRGFFGDAARGRQSEALLQALPADGHGIAGGDLNTLFGPREPAWRAFAERFQDTPPAPHEPTFHARLVLDHLFFDLPEGWEARRHVLADRYGSDHHPVLGLIHVAGSELHLTTAREARPRRTTEAVATETRTSSIHSDREHGER